MKPLKLPHIPPPAYPVRRTRNTGAGKYSTPAVGISHVKDPSAKAYFEKKVAAAASKRQYLDGMAARHKVSCAVCSSPLRTQIEADFISWHDPHNIAETYEIEHRPLVEHCIITGLYKKRAGNHKAWLRQVREAAMEALWSKTGKALVADGLRATEALIRMEGGFDDHLTIRAEWKQKAEEYMKLSPEERKARRKEIQAALIHPEREAG